MMRNDARRPSKKLTRTDAIEVWRRHWRGDFQNRIAADFDVNPGRINEVLKGKLHPGTEIEAQRHN